MADEPLPQSQPHLSSGSLGPHAQNEDENNDNNKNNKGGESSRPIEKKRRRPPLACEQCRKRKIRCDRTSPCTNCIKANSPACTYAPTHIPAWRSKKAAEPAASAVNHASTSDSSLTANSRASASVRAIKPASFASETCGTSFGDADFNKRSSSGPSSLGATQESPSLYSSQPTSSSGASNVDWLVARVQELEEKLAKVVQISDNKEKAGRPQEEASQEMVEPLTGGLVGKSRYLGQSHWMHGIDLFPLEHELIGRVELEKGDLYWSLARCKDLARKVKKNRLKPLSSTNLGTQIPIRSVADVLVDNYLRTFEGVFRIVHVPTFRADYERYWQNPMVAEESFVIMLQLCMSLGALVYDSIFSLRPTATQWIYEAQLWLMLPPEKKRVSITGVQILCLLTLAKNACGVGHDVTWIMSGTLVRKAMFLGLHRDPRHLNDMTVYRAEMRRRLWATVLELNMQFSIEAGGSPLLFTNQWDTRAPANLNDDQLSDEKDGVQYSLPNQEAMTTQTSIQRALFATIPLRIRLINHVNNTRPGDAYEETLRLNSDLTKTCRALSHSFSAMKNELGSPIKSIHVSMAEMFLYRCFHSLHQPVIIRYLNDPRFYFSRKMCLDSALKISHIWGLPNAWVSAESPTEEEPMDADLKCLVTTGSGVFRNVASQAILLISVELLNRKTGQSSSLGYLPTVGSSDLYGRLAAAQAWKVERGRAGETNTKSMIFIRACLAHVDALEAELDAKDKIKAVFQASADVSRQCLETLKTVAEREGLPPSAWEEKPEDNVEVPASMTIDWMQVWDDVQGMTWPQWDVEATGLVDEMNTFETDQY